jgi:protein gp37
MPTDEVVEFTLPDDTAAVRFVSHDPLLGDVAETWFRRNGHDFQLSVSAPDRELQDAWVRDIAANLTFPDDGAADASTQEQ